MAESELEARANEAVRLADALPAADRNLIKRILELRSQAHGHAAEENANMAQLARSGAAVIARAVELEHAEGRAVNENMTLAEALAVLERHGESSGIPPELANMVVEISVEQDEERIVPAAYPVLTDASKFREWDGSEQAEVWARLIGFRDECIVESVGMLAGTDIEGIDYAGAIALLWNIGEDEAEEIVRRRQGR